MKGKETAGKPDGPKEKAKEPEVLGCSAPVPSTDLREQRRTADVADQAQDVQREIHVEDVAPAISSPESSMFISDTVYGREDGLC